MKGTIEYKDLSEALFTGWAISRAAGKGDSRELYCSKKTVAFLKNSRIILLKRELLRRRPCLPFDF
jgi:hypothetical protein